MSAISHNLHDNAIVGAVLMLLILSACSPLPTTTPLAAERVLVTSAKTDTCEACDQETLVAAMVQEQNKFDIQAVATAEILRANAQATLNSAKATLNAVQTQEQNNADTIAAKIAATAEIDRANAKATLVAAGSTQSAALTQDVILQTQVEYNLQVTEALATQNAMAMATQQQLEKQRLVPITFLWMWCLPIFLLLLAGLVLWGVWRWLKVQQAPLIKDQQGNSSPILKRGRPKNRLRVTKPDYLQVSRWLDSVKRKLLSNEKKDENDDGD